eukprot:gene7880-12349_t
MTSVPEGIKNPADIHFYYDEKTKESALKVREELQKAFPVLTFYKPHFENIGPHLKWMWEADFTNSKNFFEDFGTIVYWLMMNRNGHSILIHPHTGDGLKDHVEHPIWLGDKLELNLKAFEE